MVSTRISMLVRSTLGLTFPFQHYIVNQRALFLLQLQQTHNSNKLPNAGPPGCRDISKTSTRQQPSQTVCQQEANSLSHTHTQTDKGREPEPDSNSFQLNQFPGATMPKERKPWFCKPCKSWCHSDMEACPKCIQKEALRFPIVKSSNPVGFGGASELGTGGDSCQDFGGETEMVGEEETRSFLQHKEGRDVGGG
jgi:hypothetical protein